MYKIMIVDDEKYIRLSIRNRIDWQSYGLWVVGEAGDGEEAYAAVKLYHPDIMLVDIRMPVLDGLGLTALLAENYSHIRVIILSAFKDFSYAKKAIQLGVEDYLLKPIDEAELDGILKRIIRELDHEEPQKQVPELDPAHWQQAGCSGKQYCCASCYIPGMSEEALWKLAAVQLCELMERLAFKSLPQLHVCVIKGNREGAVISFLLMREGLSDHECHSFLSKVQAEAGILHKGMLWGISGVCQKPEALEKQIAESVRFLKRKLFSEDTVLYDRRSDVSCGSRAFTEARQILPVLYHLSVRESYDRMEELALQLTGQYLSKMKRIEEVEYLVEELLAVLKSVAQKKGDPYDTRILFHDFLRQDYLLEYDNLKQLSDGLEDIVKTVFSFRADYGTRDVTRAIRDYIQENYMENVTTKTISQKFHLNSTYLSTLFREKSGMTLTSYIEGVRMEKAAELLRHESVTVAEVAAAIGYTDTNYFGKVFKKYSGMTPGQYKSSKGQQVMQGE